MLSAVPFLGLADGQPAKTKPLRNDAKETEDTEKKTKLYIDGNFAGEVMKISYYTFEDDNYCIDIYIDCPFIVPLVFGYVNEYRIVTKKGDDYVFRGCCAMHELPDCDKDNYQKVRVLFFTDTASSTNYHTVIKKIIKIQELK